MSDPKKWNIMKQFIYFLLGMLILASCGSDDTETNDNPNQQVKKEESKSKSGTPDDERVSGSFEVDVDGKTYKSTQLQDNYCDMNYNFKGDKSFVSVRFRDVDSRDVMLVSIYGDEDYISNPEGKIDKFMLSGQFPIKANIQFIPGDGQGSMTSFTMAEGTLNISKVDDGIFEGDFSGMGGTPMNVAKKENLIPFSGSFALRTVHVKKYGNVDK